MGGALFAALAGPDSSHAQAIQQSPVEVVTTQAATGDGGNSWGGHQTRVVRTADGVFTAYTVESAGPFARQWRLAHRHSDGTWRVVAVGGAGKDPVNLLAAPSGTLYVIGWPEGVGTVWALRFRDGATTMTSEVIPQVARGHWPYASAGIDAGGNLCVLSSSGGETAGGHFDWACYLPARGQWVTRRSALDYRFAYTYLFPDPMRQLSLVSTRDVRWEALGYQKPAGEFDYVFDAFGYWRARDVIAAPLERLSFAEERQTVDHAAPFLNAQMDAYLDTDDRMHILYWRRGATTGGQMQRRHRIVLPSGVVVHDGELPSDAGWHCRIFQDADERYYLLGSAGLLYPMDPDGVGFGTPWTLDLGGFPVEYSGFGISVPRTGTPLGGSMDVVFPAGDGTHWIYFRIDLPARVAQHPSRVIDSNTPRFRR